MPWRTYNTTDLRSKYLYRFVAKEYLLEFLETRCIWFSRADRFGDKMECVRALELLEEKPDYGRILERKERHLISCWHAADNESLALWDTYVDELSKRRVAAIRFFRSKLAEWMAFSLPHNERFSHPVTYTHGAVRYKNLLTWKPSDFEGLLVKYPAFRKEKAFAYENEYRFVIHLPRKYHDRGYAYHLLEPPAISFDIILNPLLGAAEYNSLKQEVADKGYGEYLKDSPLNKWLHPEDW